MKQSKSKIIGILLDGIFIVAGSALFATSVNMFTAPNNIAPGGLTGLGTIINYLTGLPIGTVILLGNIPIFIWAYFETGFRFLTKTIATTLVSSIFIDVSALWLPAYYGDTLLVTVFGGLLSGAGLSLIFLRGGTTGGTDLAANLLNRHFPHISIGKFILAIDLIVILFSALVYRNLESPLYGVIIIFITSKVVDAILYGANTGTGKTMFVMSPKTEEIAQAVMKNLERGATLLTSVGAYTKRQGYTLLLAVRRHEVYKTYEIIYQIDPHAFIVVGDAGNITGEGFLRHPAETKKETRRLKKRKASSGKSDSPS